MTPTYTQHTASRLERAKSLLAEQIKAAYASPAFSPHATNETAVVRLEVAANDVPLLSWLAAQRSPVKTFWSNRDSRFEMAGIGAADIVSSMDEIDHKLLFARMNRLIVGGNENLRYYGGGRFSGAVNNASDTVWRSFGSYRFVMPRFELFRQSNRTHLACNLIVGADRTDTENALDELSNIVVSIKPLDSESLPMAAPANNPDKEGWAAMVAAALGSIDNGDLGKLVLARRTSYELALPPNPMELLQRLQQAEPGCYYFGFQADDDHAFLGATPERLYQRAGRLINSEAVGGTRPRGANPDEDEVLAKDLRHSAKELNEHRYVIDSVQKVLNGLCRSVESSDGSFLLRTAAVQHLITRFQGMLDPNVSDADILRTLHPTPAVGGCPTDVAVEKINRLEPFDRGWYAGPVGWVSGDAAEFAVGIRCGLIACKRLHLYSGAGIVRGSTAEDEWREIDSKMSSFRRVFFTPCSLSTPA